MIIKELANSNQYLSIDYFIEKLSISKRTVQKELAYISNISTKNGFSITQKRGKGYLLEVHDDEKLKKLLLELDESIYELNADNLISYLAIKENYTTVEELANYFQMSTTSVRNYIKKLDEYLEDYSLTLDRKAHYGIKIKEEMFARRYLILKMYLDNNKIILNEINSAVEDGFENLEDIIISYVKEAGNSINDSEFKKITCLIKIIIYINKIYKNKEISTYEKEYINRIQNKYNVGISCNQAEEIDFILEKFSKSEKDNESISLEDLKEDMNTFLKEIDDEYHTNFCKDEDFKTMLISHIHLLIDRLKSKVSYTNGIIEEILIRYPMVFNIAIKFSEILSKKYGVEITEDEVGFIATHFCVHMEKEEHQRYLNINKIAIVCSTGGGSSYLLQMKIRTLFRKAETRAFSFYDLKDIEEFKPDVILSIKELDLKLNIPIIIIKEFLDDDDIVNIKKLLIFDDIDRQVSIKETKNVFIKRILNKKYFKIENREIDYIDIISEMAEEIEEEGIGGEGYKSRVLEREGYVSTVYTNGIAIPHPIEIASLDDLVSVRVVKSNVKSEGKDVNIIFMVSLQKKNYELQKEITKSLYNLMQNMDVIKKILKVKTYEEFIALIEPFI